MAVALGPKGPGITAAAPAKAPSAVKEVAFIVDKSGSMESCQEATINGYNEYVGDLQKATELTINFSATFFDTAIDPRVQGLPVGQVPKLSRATYRPDGLTALYDAIGITLKHMEERLKGDTETPVVVVIQTDGLENSSREYNEGAIRERIQALTAQGNWTFAFLGADIDAWGAAQQIGISFSNTKSYVKSETGETLIGNSQSTLKHLRSSARQSTDFYEK